MTKEERQERDLPEGIVRRSGTPTLYMRFMVNGERVSLSTGETLVKRAVAVMEAKKVDIKKRQHTESLFSPVEREMLAEEREKVKVRKPTMTFREFAVLPDAATGFAGGEFWTRFATATYTVKGVPRLMMEFTRNRIKAMLGYAPLADAKLHQITGDLLTQYITYRKGQGWKPSTIRADHTVLKIVMKQAAAQGLIKAVPTENVPKRPSDSELGMPGIAMEIAEEDIYFSTPGLHPDLDLLASIMITTSLEPGTLARLDWKDVHFQGTGVSHDYIHGQCKKAATRERNRPMSPKVARLLRERWLAQGCPETGPVFPSCRLDQAGGPKGIGAFQKYHWAHLARIRRTVPGQRRFRAFRLYDFRHTYLTRYWQETKNMMGLMHVAGWTSLKQAKTYIHMNDAEYREADLAVFQKFAPTPAEATTGSRVAAD